MVKSNTENWIKCDLTDIGKIVTGNTPPKKIKRYYYDGSIDFVKPSDIQNQVITTFNEKISEDARNVARIAPANSVLVTCIGELGRIGLTLKEAAFNQQINCIIPDENKIVPKFLFYRLQIEKKQLANKASATTVVILNKSKFCSIKITYPKDEKVQRAIVDVIETQFTRLDVTIKSLKAIRDKFKSYRQSILKDVFRRAKTTKRLGDILTFKNGINFSKQQKGSGVLTVDVLSMYSKDICLRTSNLYRVDINLKEDYILKEGDILFVRSSVKREGVGYACLFSPIEEPVTFCGFLIRGRLINDEFLPRYLLHFLRSAKARRETIGQSSQVVITNISQGNLSKVEVPFLSLSEQENAIQEIESRFSVIDKVGEVVEKSLLKAERLRKSILKAAFEGKLVN